jgi:hypothetical protein
MEPVMKKNDLYSGRYAALVLGYNDKLCQNEEQRKRGNESKKRKALELIRKNRQEGVRG